MEILVQIVFILSLLKYCLKAALSGRFWVISLYGISASLFAMLIYPYVINLPVNIISELLTNHKLVTDGAILTTIEATLGIFVSILLLDNYFMPRQKRRKSFKLLKGLPGVLIFPAIAYFELLFFKINVGASFITSAIIYSIILAVSIMIISLFIKWQMRHESVKLELKIMINLAILVIGLLINSTVADYNLSNAQTVVEWKALFTMLIIVIILFITGLFFTKNTIKSLLKIK